MHGQHNTTQHRGGGGGGGGGGEERERDKRRRRRGGGEGLTWKNAQPRYRTPESVQRWKPVPSGSRCQLADIGMRGLFIGNAGRQTLGGHSVWQPLRLALSLSLSLAPLPLSPSKRCRIPRHGLATSERRERASIPDQLRARNKLQRVLGDKQPFSQIVLLRCCRDVCAASGEAGPCERERDLQFINIWTNANLAVKGQGSKCCIFHISFFLNLEEKLSCLSSSVTHTL